MASSSWATTVALLGLHVFLGAMILSHGYAKIFRGGKLAGTGRWFESIGMKPGSLHAYLAAGTEVGCGTLLIVGLATPLAAGALVALMTVAIVTVHRMNGFFVYNKGQGIEYCLSLIVAALVCANFGSGRISLDYLARHLSIATWIWHPNNGLVVAAIVGFGGAAAQLITFYRPPKVEKSGD